MRTKCPILRRVVYRARRTSFFLFLCTFCSFLVVHSICTLGQKIHEGGSIKIRPSNLNARPKRNKMCIKRKKKKFDELYRLRAVEQDSSFSFSRSRLFAPANFTEIYTVCTPSLVRKKKKRRKRAGVPGDIILPKKNKSEKYEFALFFC